MGVKKFKQLENNLFLTASDFFNGTEKDIFNPVKP